MAVCDNPSLRIKRFKTLCRPCAGISCTRSCPPCAGGGVSTLCRGPCARIYTQVRKQYVWTLCQQPCAGQPCAKIFFMNLVPTPMPGTRLAQGRELLRTAIYIYIYIYTYMAVRSNSRPCANLVPGRRGRHKGYKKRFGTRLPGTRSIRIVFGLVYEFWHKVFNSPPAQGIQPPVFHDVAQGRHKVSDSLFRKEGLSQTATHT